MSNQKEINSLYVTSEKQVNENLSNLTLLSIEDLKNVGMVADYCYKISTHSDADVFFSYSPHINSYDVSIYPESWKVNDGNRFDFSIRLDRPQNCYNNIQELLTALNSYLETDNGKLIRKISNMEKKLAKLEENHNQKVKVLETKINNVLKTAPSILLDDQTKNILNRIIA